MRRLVDGAATVQGDDQRRHPRLGAGLVSVRAAEAPDGAPNVLYIVLDDVPITTLSPAGNVVTRNPIDVDVVDGRLRLYLAPDDNATTVFTYEAQCNRLGRVRPAQHTDQRPGRRAT